MAMELDTDSPIKDELFKAANSGDVSLFKSVSQQQLSEFLSGSIDEDERSLLHVAVASSQPEVVKYLAEIDSIESVINKKDEGGWAPIHSAASIGNTNIIATLVNKGADVSIKNESGRTALHYAASKGWFEIAELLVSHGAKINTRDKVGCTPLHRAASTGNARVCELLIEEGAEIDEVDKLGQTPLMLAVICEHREAALLLIRHGADVDIQDKEEYTVLGRASDDLRKVIIDAAKAMLEG